MNQTTFYILAGLLLLLLLGSANIRQKLRNLAERRQTTQTYSRMLDAFLSRVSTHRFDNEASRTHRWLVKRSGAMQTELGDDGLLSWQLPAALGGGVDSHYEILTNEIPKLRNEVVDASRLPPSSNPAYNQAARHCMDAIDRHNGRLADLQRELLQERRNPLALLREGIEFLVTLPILLLVWSGLLEYGRLLRVTETRLGRLLGVVLALATFLAAIVQIISGWPQVRQLF